MRILVTIKAKKSSEDGVNSGFAIYGVMYGRHLLGFMRGLKTKKAIKTTSDGVARCYSLWCHLKGYMSFLTTIKPYKNH